MGCEVSKPIHIETLAPNPQMYNMAFITSDLEPKDVISVTSSLHVVDA